MSARGRSRPEKVADWRERLALVVATMREMSRQTDPQEMRAHLRRSHAPAAADRRLACRSAAAASSRRGTASRAARAGRKRSTPGRKPTACRSLSGGLLAELIYGDEPRLFDDLRVADDDPAAEYLAEFRSVVAIPLYDGGEALNMALLMRREPGAFDPEELPDMVMMSNLFGRATLQAGADADSSRRPTRRPTTR